MSNPPNNQENQPQENKPTESINTTTSANSSIIKGGRVLTKRFTLNASKNAKGSTEVYRTTTGDKY